MVILDQFSKFVQLRILPNNKANSVFNYMKEALPFFGDYKYKKLLTDRVSNQLIIENI